MADSYDRLLASVGRVASHVGDGRLTSHWPLVGRNFDHSVLVVGQAVYGWIPDWTANDATSAAGRSAILDDTRATFSELDDPMSWIAVIASRTRRSGARPTRSPTRWCPIWRVPGSAASRGPTSTRSRRATTRAIRGEGVCASSHGLPHPGRSCTVRRVAGSAQHRAVGDVERSTASGERHDVIDGQVAGVVRGTEVARAPVPVQATPGAEHSGAEALPCPRAVKGVVAAARGLSSVRGAATALATRDNTADRAELHSTRPMSAMARLTLVTLDCEPFDIATSEIETGTEVYSPAVLRLRGQPGLTPRSGRVPTPAGGVARG